MGRLTQLAVDSVGDGQSKKALQEARDMGVGVATLLHNQEDPQDHAVVQLLAEVNLGMRDAVQLAMLGGALIDADAECDFANAAARAAALKRDRARAKLHDATTSFANLARGKLGAKSLALEMFGIKAIGGRKGVKRATKAKATPAKDSDTTPKSKKRAEDVFTRARSA